MDYVTHIITNEEKDKIINFYKDFQIQNNGSYIAFFAKTNDINITIYESKKGYKVVFQGDNALNEAKIFFNDAKVNIKKEKIETCFLDLKSQIGSDEVGTGDVFGPLVVTACYYDENEFNDLNIKIDDSKKLTDEYILKTVPLIIKKLTFCKYTLTPYKYNLFIEKGYNMNKIKSTLHNLALLSLSKKVKYDNAYMDMFCSEKDYFNYLSNQEVVLNDIIFITKGESHYPSIALASMISRYSFLKSLEEMNKEYNFNFPKGASFVVDNAIDDFIKTYGKDKLKNVAKCNFINIKRKI